MQLLTVLLAIKVMKLQDSILVAGYPLGGDSLSITKGIVSRVRLPCNHHAYLAAAVVMYNACAHLASQCQCLADRHCK